jgi:hypothetical protein
MKGTTWPTIQNGNFTSYFNLPADFISGHKSTGGVYFFITPRTMRMERQFIFYMDTRANKTRITFAFQFKLQISPVILKILLLPTDI